ncbi:MAG: hypothetical protein IJV35_04505 [Neisseriaceae bacterium]|nr:hypothetical protein [Neisseriaceae bacterium]
MLKYCCFIVKQLQNVKKTVSLRAVMKSRRGNPLETAGFKQRRKAL